MALQQFLRPQCGRGFGWTSAAELLVEDNGGPALGSAPLVAARHASVSEALKMKQEGQAPGERRRSANPFAQRGTSVSCLDSYKFRDFREITSTFGVAVTRWKQTASNKFCEKGLDRIGRRIRNAPVSVQ
jgi:hypothetical protein